MNRKKIRKKIFNGLDDQISNKVNSNIYNYVWDEVYWNINVQIEQINFKFWSLLFVNTII